jgi:hypothetical protein
MPVKRRFTSLAFWLALVAGENLPFIYRFLFVVSWFFLA